MSKLFNSPITQETDPQASAWRVKLSNGVVYGPVELGELREWAEECRLTPGDQVSSDAVHWVNAETLPELAMQWMVEMASGEIFGPVNLHAIVGFVHSHLVIPNSRLVNRVTGEKSTVADLVLPLIPDAPKDETPSVVPVVAENATSSDRSSAEIAEKNNVIRRSEAELIKTHGDFEAGMHDLRDRLGRATSDYDSTLNNLREKESSLSTAVRERDLALQSARDLDSVRSEKESRIQTLTRQIETSTADETAMSSVLEQYRAELEQAHQETREMATRAKGINEDIPVLSEQTQNVSEVPAASEEEVASQRERIEVIEGEHLQKETQLQAKIEELTGCRNGLNQELETMRGELPRREADIKAMSERVISMENSVIEAGNEAKQQKIRCQRLQKELDQTNDAFKQREMLWVREKARLDTEHTAPRVIGAPSERDYAPGFFGKRRMLGWGIVFLIAVVATLSVIFELVPAEVKDEKNSNMAAVEQRGKQKAFIGAIEKEKAVPQTRVAELEQKWKTSAQLQAELAKARNLSAEAEAGLQQAKVAKTVSEQDLATLKARQGEVSQKAVEAEEQAKQVQALQDEIGREKQRQESLFQDAAKVCKVMLAAEKERADLQAQVDAQAKRMIEVMNTVNTADQVQEELAREKQVSTEREAEIVEANQARAAAAQAIVGLKQKIAEGEKQAKVLKRKGELLTQRQAELARARKLSVETDADLQQAKVAKTASEQDLATLRARLKEVSQKVVTAREQANQVQALQDEIGKEKQWQESLLREMARACEAVQAAKKKRADLQAQVTETPTVEQFDIDRGEPPSNAIELAKDTDRANTTSGFLSAGSEANRYYKAGIQKWDAGDVDGAIAEFKKTIRLDSSAAGVYYNIALGYVAKGDRYKACDYAYQAGEIYFKNKRNNQANRVVEFMKIVDPSSSLIEKLRKKIPEKESLSKRVVWSPMPLRP
ncbi:hypothetical protein ACFLQR_00900 [Verrucomicrobiota bacterium]